MKIDMNQLPEKTLPGMNGGTGEMSAKMTVIGTRRLILCRIHPGGSIGRHEHTENEDVNYVISGNGKAVCGGEEEILLPGVVHICPKGDSHSITNTGKDDLVLFTCVC